MSLKQKLSEQEAEINQLEKITSAKVSSLNEVTPETSFSAAVSPSTIAGNTNGTYTHVVTLVLRDTFLSIHAPQLLYRDQYS